MMLAIDLSYIVFIMLKYVPSISSFLYFCHERVLNFVKGFSASVEMIKLFLSLFLLMCCITFNDLRMLNHPCIPGMKLI
jgi:hypothetical protein